MTEPRVVARKHIDPDHDVISIESAGEGRSWHYRRTPCGGCPWRIDQTGSFPAGAFEASADTAYDLSGHMFGCHESGTERPSTCAGFLLRGADDNMAVRMRMIRGGYDPDTVTDGGLDLHESYRAMAIANGVDPAADSLRRCAR